MWNPSPQQNMHNLKKPVLNGVQKTHMGKQIGIMIIRLTALLLRIILLILVAFLLVWNLLENDRRNRPVILLYESIMHGL